MFILSYAINRMRRCVKGCSALALLSLVFVLFLCLLNHSIVQKEQQLDEVYNNLEVECVVSNLQGTQTDNLYIKNYITSVFLSNVSSYHGVEDEMPISSYINKLKLKFTLKYKLLLEGETVAIPDIRNADPLIGLTYISADSLMTPENGIRITYFDGYSEELFLQDKPVCIVSSGLYETLPKDEQGVCYFGLAVGDPAQEDEIYVEQELQVVGTYDGDGLGIYCPWEIVKTLSFHLTGQIYADSLSFVIRDNRQIDTLKQLLARYFTNVDITGKLTEYEKTGVLINYEYAITVYDSIFNQTISNISDNIRTLKMMKPVMIGLALGISFLASFLFIRNRRQEFAIMRSLGTKRGMVFIEAFSEQLILGLIGTVLGLLIYYAWNRCITIPPWKLIATYGVSYLSGATIAVYWITKVKVMAIMKAKE